MCLGSAIYMGYISPRVEFGRINFGIFTVICAIFTALGVMTYCCFKSLDALISTFNEILELAVDLEKGTAVNSNYFLNNTDLNNK